MSALDPTLKAAFPPLEGGVVLKRAPAPVRGLLERRWMASIEELHEPPPEGDGGTTIDFRAAELTTPATEGASEVRWEPHSNGGSLVNPAGSIQPSILAPHSIVHLDASSEHQPEAFETLLEAALANALLWNGQCFLHAGALRLHDQLALVIGASGAGKSTLGAAFASSGGKIISDDSLVLGSSGGRPLVRSARRNVWLRPGSEPLLEALGEAGVAVRRGPDGRYVVARDENPEVFEAGGYPTHLVLLERGEASTTVAAEPMDQASALSALLRGTSALYVTDPRFASSQERLLGLLTLFAEQLTAVHVRLGPALLERTEESLAALGSALS